MGLLSYTGNYNVYMYYHKQSQVSVESVAISLCTPTLTKSDVRHTVPTLRTFHAVRETLHVCFLHVFGRDPLTQHAAHAVACDGHRVALGVRTDHSLALDARHVSRVSAAEPAVNTHQVKAAGVKHERKPFIHVNSTCNVLSATATGGMGVNSLVIFDICQCNETNR